MEWSKLLCDKRPGERGGNMQYDGLVSSPFERDYFTIVCDSHFRRLEGKTQVFTPLLKNDFVRDRLTHSMEVSCIAAILGKRIGEKLEIMTPEDFFPEELTEIHELWPNRMQEKLKAERDKYDQYEWDIQKSSVINDLRSKWKTSERRSMQNDYAQKLKNNYGKRLPRGFADDLSMVLRCAGLLHDIGNPPFGHACEGYIREYFKEKEVSLKDGFTDQMWMDLINFEGNAQNIRIVTKYGKSSDTNPKHYGMNLTYAVINSVIKYPFSSIGKENPDKPGKIGFYNADEWIVDFVMNGTGTKIEGSKPLKGLRNPIMLLMEAADDIAYATADIEDALKQRVFTVNEKEQIENFNETNSYGIKINMVEKKGGYGVQEEKISEIQQKLKEIREDAVNEVVQRFIDIENYESIMRGAYIDSDGKPGELIDLSKLKEFSAIFYKTRDEETEKEFELQKKVENALDNAINAITKQDDELSYEEFLIRKKMRKYVENSKREFANIKYIKEYSVQECSDENYRRYFDYLAAIDYVSGMTDRYIVEYDNEIDRVKNADIEKKQTALGILDNVPKKDGFRKINEAFRIIEEVYLSAEDIHIIFEKLINDPQIIRCCDGNNSNNEWKRKIIKDLLDREHNDEMKQRVIDAFEL